MVEVMYTSVSFFNAETGLCLIK